MQPQQPVQHEHEDGHASDQEDQAALLAMDFGLRPPRSGMWLVDLAVTGCGSWVTASDFRGLCLHVNTRRTGRLEFCIVVLGVQP